MEKEGRNKDRDSIITARNFYLNAQTHNQNGTDEEVPTEVKKSNPLAAQTLVVQTDPAAAPLATTCAGQTAPQIPLTENTTISDPTSQKTTTNDLEAEILQLNEENQNIRSQNEILRKELDQLGPAYNELVEKTIPKLKNEISVLEGKHTADLIALGISKDAEWQKKFNDLLKETKEVSQQHANSQQTANTNLPAPRAKLTYSAILLAILFGTLPFLSFYLYMYL